MFSRFATTMLFIVFCYVIFRKLRYIFHLAKLKLKYKKPIILHLLENYVLFQLNCELIFTQIKLSDFIIIFG